MLGSEKEEEQTEGNVGANDSFTDKWKSLDGINENLYILQEHLKAQNSARIDYFNIKKKAEIYVSIKEREKVREQKRKFSH